MFYLSKCTRPFFIGNYIRNGIIKERTLADLHIFQNHDEINAFQKLVGSNYINLFINSFELVHREDDTENINTRIYVGGIPCLHTLMEGIIIIDSSNNIWAAVIDDSVVRYFTNVSNYSNHLPEDIEKWRERFQDKK